MRPSLSSYLRATSPVLFPVREIERNLAVASGQGLEPGGEVEADARHISRRRVPVLHDNLHPSLLLVPLVQTFKDDVFQPLAVARRHVLDVQFPSDLAAVADLTGGVLRQWRRVRLFNFSPLVEPKVGEHRIADAFLYGFGTGFGVKVAERYLELAADGGQHREKSRVPYCHPLPSCCGDHVNLLCCDRAVVLAPCQYPDTA